MTIGDAQDEAECPFDDRAPAAVTAGTVKATRASAARRSSGDGIVRALNPIEREMLKSHMNLASPLLNEYLSRHSFTWRGAVPPRSFEGDG